jgi:hypothetical protein
MAFVPNRSVMSSPAGRHCDENCAGASEPHVLFDKGRRKFSVSFRATAHVRSHLLVFVLQRIQAY